MDNEAIKPAQSVLAVDAHIASSVIPRMNELAFFTSSAGSSRVERKDIFMLAAAFGFHSQLAAKLSTRGDGGFVRTSYFSDRQNALMKAMQFAQSDFSDTDALRDLHSIYALAEEYANGGFQIIEGDLDNNVGSEELANSLVLEMIQLYDEYMGGE